MINKFQIGDKILMKNNEEYYILITESKFKKDNFRLYNIYKDDKLNRYYTEYYERGKSKSHAMPKKSFIENLHYRVIKSKKNDNKINYRFLNDK